MCSKICSNDVSQSIITLLFCLFEPSLSARNLSWWALSSPLTYSIRLSVMRSIVCRVSVLLPIPGSPPSKTILPGTNPPPRTRFNSVSLVSIRGSSFADISCRYRGLFEVPATDSLTDCAADLAAIEPVSPAILISLKVFHCPHEGHLPIHFADSCPQLEHTYAILSFAIISYSGRYRHAIYAVNKNSYYFPSIKIYY